MVKIRKLSVMHKDDSLLFPFSTPASASDYVSFEAVALHT